MCDQQQLGQKPRKSFGKLEGKAGRRRKARERLGIGVEMWQPARLTINFDEKRGLALTGPPLRPVCDDGNEPAAILELRQQGIGHLGHAAVQRITSKGPAWGAARVSPLNTAALLKPSA